MLLTLPFKLSPLERPGAAVCPQISLTSLAELPGMEISLPIGSQSDIAWVKRQTPHHCPADSSPLPGHPKGKSLHRPRGGQPWELRGDHSIPGKPPASPW